MSDPWRKRVELCGGRAVCYLGDCLDILPTLEAGSVDAVVTDPPYGTNYYKTDCRASLAPVFSCGAKSVMVFGWPERLAALCVVYAEPYPMKEAKDILRLGGVAPRKFEGVKSTAYFRIYPS